MTINIQGLVYATEADKSVAITAFDGGNQINIQLSRFQALDLARDLANLAQAGDRRARQDGKPAPF